jgi:hypothetical protein
VDADTKVIFKGDPLPTLTSTIKGFAPGDSAALIVSGPTHTLTPLIIQVILLQEFT